MKKESLSKFKIILITGSPASGKLTVGQKLSKKLNIPLFHNHIIIDLVKNLFPNEQKKSSLREPLFFNILSFAAKQNHSLILTYVYAKNYTSPNGLNDLNLVKKIKKITEINNGKFISIHLSPSKNEILKRTNAPSRSKFHKLRDLTEMKKILTEWDVKTAPLKESIIIDNSKLSAENTAKYVLNEVNQII
jgi:shikimate kinase